MPAPEESKLVHARFTTKLQSPFKVPAASIAIPSDLSRLGLSSVVNNLLKAGNSDWEHEPFDFLIEGELVRVPLEQFLIAKGISAEKVLEIEYIKAAVPRKEEEPCPHDEWVSAVDGSNPGFILTGCYDKLGRLWKSPGVCSHILEGHEDAVTSISVINPNGMASADNVFVATASEDQTLRLWKCDAKKPTDKCTRVAALQILSGHEAAVSSVSPQHYGNMICSGSWDHTIKLWEINLSDVEDSVLSVKKRKADNTRVDMPMEGEAASTLTGHTDCVSSVKWPQHGTIYSASWDHSVRIWDVETGKESWNASCGHVHHCLDVGGESSALIAAGGADNILRVWDPRKPGTLAPIYKFSSHTKWIKACKWHPRSWLHLVSASHDGKVKMWDLRTQLSLVDIESHQGKVFCADWWRDDSVLSGGEDGKLRIASRISVL